jgi:signal peptidase I
MEKLKKRRPIVTFLLSIVSPGLGQIYNGQFKKGLFYLVGFSLATIIFSFLLFKFYGMIFYLLIMIGFYLFILSDALFGAIKLKAISFNSYNKWYIYLIIFLLSSVIISPLLSWIIKNNIARTWKIPSSSMEPTLLVGDHLVADMRIYKSEKPKRGDIIIFEFPKDPSKNFIMRAIAIGEEKVGIIRNRIYINDKLIDDPWGHFSMPRSPIEDYAPVKVPPGCLFVMGDNRDNSRDSRFWGFVNIEKVKGKALYLYWAKDKTRIGMEIK